MTFDLRKPGGRNTDPSGLSVAEALTAFETTEVLPERHEPLAALRTPLCRLLGLRWTALQMQTHVTRRPTDTS